MANAIMTIHGGLVVPATALGHGGVFAALTSKQARHIEAQKALWERYGHRELTLLDAPQTRQIVCTEHFQAALLDAARAISIHSNWRRARRLRWSR